MRSHIESNSTFMIEWNGVANTERLIENDKTFRRNEAYRIVCELRCDMIHRLSSITSNAASINYGGCSIYPEEFDLDPKRCVGWVPIHIMPFVWKDVEVHITFKCENIEWSGDSTIAHKPVLTGQRKIRFENPFYRMPEMQHYYFDITAVGTFHRYFQLQGKMVRELYKDEKGIQQPSSIKIDLWYVL